MNLTKIWHIENRRTKMKNFKMVVIVLFSLITVLGFSVFTMQGVQNRAISLEEQINVASSDIEVQEKRRVDLVYNLVDTVKAYDKHEYKTLKDTVTARAGGKGDISEVTTMIAATAEAYPDLKSNANYKQLMNELSITENMIAEHRSNYNKQIKEYSRYTRKFPNASILEMLGYECTSNTYLDYKAPVDAPQNLFGEW